MEYPFRYDKPNIGDTCWFVTETGPVKTTIVDKHDNYFNKNRNIYKEECEKQEDYLIDYWIEDYPYHGLVFGTDLFETYEEAVDTFNSQNELPLKLKYKKEIVFNFNSKGSYPPSNLSNFIKWLQEKLKLVPKKYRNYAIVNVENFDISIYYYRPETKEEEIERKKFEDYNNEILKQQELKLLAELKEKYRDELPI